jgi:hypothetical protein
MAAWAISLADAPEVDTFAAISMFGDVASAGRDEPVVTLPGAASIKLLAPGIGRAIAATG